ncbi:MAG: Apocarotenoid-15,15'-oxygenase, partial [Okeania sp. SIO2D1]|nr:Apocarotenoid-15,15'-oxygenase [Okeania sp. SIO2D1]
SFIHDFAISANYCIFFQSAVQFNPLPYIFGFKGAGECVHFRPHLPTRIIIVPRDPKAGKPVKVLSTKAGFVFHHTNAFEQDGNIYLDSICYDSLYQVKTNMDYREIDFDELAPGQLWRFTLNLEEETVEQQLLLSRCCEFPAVHPDKVGRPYRYAYLGGAHQELGNAPLQGIVKVDTISGQSCFWSTAPDGFVSEPVFVPRPQAKTEDDGWILTMVYNGKKHRSEIVILDAANFEGGAIARLPLKHHIPYGLHGNWTNEYFAQT